MEILSKGDYARLNATAHDLDSLKRAMDEFERQYFRDADGKWSSPNEDERAHYDISQIIQRIKQFKTVLIAELRTSTSFSVTRTGIFDVAMLVNGAHAVFDRGTIKAIGPEVCNEIDAAGKCLAFNLPTAVGFHSMRAVERVLKKYLSNFLSAEDIEKKKNWGQYIAALEDAAKNDNGPSEEAIALFRQIKDIYRNPVIHPEKILSVSEASTIFHSTIAAICRIASEFPNKTPPTMGFLANASVVSQIIGNAEDVSAGA